MRSVRAGILFIALLAALLAAVPFPSGAAALTTTRVASGLSNTVFATAPPGDTERLFILE